MHMRIGTSLAGTLLAIFALSGSGCSAASTREARGEELYLYCVQCHGERGEGSHEFRAPSIAGLPEWYVEAQLHKFRDGARGDHPADVDGLRMRPMARTLATRADVAIVAEHVARMPVVEEPPRLEQGDPARGRELFTPCVTCHGDRAQGKRENDAPPLADLADWYLVAQLAKFKEGIRGTDALDTTGAQMRPMAVGLADEQAMRNVAAYIRTLD